MIPAKTLSLYSRTLRAMNKLIFLGTGTSQGIPVIGCDCEVCTSDDSRDQRLRTSAYLEYEGVKINVDTGTDFRTQFLSNSLTDLDAVLYTHEHQDHVAGIDDLRAINFQQHKSIPIYAEQRVMEDLKQRFGYAVGGSNYPGAPQLIPHTIDEKVFQIGDARILPIRVYHGQLPVLGFRFGNVAYITDANEVPAVEMEKLNDLNVLVINALRRKSHHSHFTLHEALEFIEEVKPRRAFLTHLSHQMGTHQELCNELPDHIQPAYDGLQIDF